ncbi:uncharacterized protein LOC21401074 [Morus notabilis]|nr:uncharacterized protein LOC21401074 [Morus notabilis]
MEREIRSRNCIGIYSELCCHNDANRVDQTNCNGRYPTSSPSRSPSPSSSAAVLPVSSAPLPSSPPPAVGYIEHPVSKLDTLAGVAIKYGVEVADIKKMNGLVTDLQMFALKSIQIPLPGRHPPSPCLSNGSSTPGPSSSGRTPPQRMHRDLFGSFQSLRVSKSPPQHVSPAMSSLQGYYGLKPTNRNPSSEAIEMAVYRKELPNYLDDGVFTGISDPALSHHRKSKCLVNGFSENGEITNTTTPVVEARDGESDKWSEKLIRRRQKSEADFSRTPEMLLEDNSGSGGGFSAITGKHLALRPKAGSRTAMATDVEASGLNQIPVGLGDSFVTDGFSGVRKSSSTPSLQDPDSSNSISIRSASKWSLKPDIQGFSTGAIAKPIFDGLPKPITGRRSKAALD